MPRAFITITENFQSKLQLIPKELHNEDFTEIQEKEAPSENTICERMDYLVSTDTNKKEVNKVINNVTQQDLNAKLPLRELNIVKGMLLNVQKNHGVKLSSPKQVLDEVLFSLSNKEQFENINSFQHKINIISQLLRHQRWKTPKGFSKYSPSAKRYQVKYEQENDARLKLKQDELNYSGLDTVATSKRLQGIYGLTYHPSPKINLGKSLQVQQSLINGIKKDIKTIKNATILENFLKILAQEELKLSQLKGELASL